MKKLAILPGSYDPMTLGHLALVKAAAKTFEHLVIAVMINPDKHTRFTPEEHTIKSVVLPATSSRVSMAF